MSNSTSILIFLFVLLFSLVAVSLTLIQVRAINLSDKRIMKIEQHQQQYQNLLNEIYSLENKYPQNSTPNEIYELIEENRREAAKILRLLNPNLDERLSFLQLDEEFRQLRDKKDRENQEQGFFVCQNCGSQVQGGDKFCANCGFRLQG
jgi:rubrerythrin